MKTKLTPKQELFCSFYILSYNATQSAIKAGYSEKTAQQIGAENLLKPLVRDRIDLIKNDILLQLGISKVTLIKDLLEIKDNPDAKDADKIRAIQTILTSLGLDAPPEQRQAKTRQIFTIGGQEIEF